MHGWKSSGWRDLPDRIARDHDIPFIAGPHEITLLAVYCREHLNKVLTSRLTRFKTFNLYHVTCK
jgi:hypothetical protein